MKLFAFKSPAFIAVVSLFILGPLIASPDCAAAAGDAYAWGDNSVGQLGDGTTNNSDSPVQVYGLTDVKSIAGGDSHSIAVKNDGTVWTWGDNSQGQLGDGTTDPSLAPIQVPGLGGVIAVDAGNYYSVALKSDGTVWTWGDNSDGQLGDGSNDDSTSPVEVDGLTGATAICAGYGFALAAKSDGTVMAWGNNSQGQLGDGTHTPSNTPVPVDGLSGAVGVAAGYVHSSAVKSDGTVWSWGDNSLGQLGDGTGVDSDSPVQATGLSGITEIHSGDYNTVALKSDGTVHAWGLNSDGQLGDGTYTTRNSPVQVVDLTDAVSVAAGGYHTLALKSDGTVWAWGWNGIGQLGDGTHDDQERPVRAGSLTGMGGLGAGLSSSMAVEGAPQDTTPPVSAITDPLDSADIEGSHYEIKGTAFDNISGSGVALVEVSTDGGDTWQQASGTTSWSFDWQTGAPGQYTLMSKATDNASVAETPGPGISVTVSAYGISELNHIYWDAWLAGGQCTACHDTDPVNSTFLPADYMESPAFCRSCHNTAAPAHDRGLAGGPGHAVMVNATSGGAHMPTYGNVTTQAYDNRPYAHLAGGELVACMTCHNPMDKYEDFGRVFEPAQNVDNRTYALPDGGWAGLGGYTLRVYRSMSQWTNPPYSPTYSLDKKEYLVDPSEYTFDEYSGTVTFNEPQNPLAYVFATLDYPYLRATNADNRLCSDCHAQMTHGPGADALNCLDCHQAHGTSNVMLVRGQIRPPRLGSASAVVFSRYTGAGSFADGDAAYDGICEVCHTLTAYHTRDGSGAPHYDGGDCTVVCHPHSTGFAK